MATTFSLRRTAGGSTLRGGNRFRTTAVIVIGLGQVTETDTALSLTGGSTATSRALRMTVVKGHVIGPVVETDTAFQFVRPAAIRALGALAVTVTRIPRPSGQTRTRQLGDLTIHGRQTPLPDGLLHVRGQGIPQLSGHAIGVGLVHTRGLGSPEVNLRVLLITGLNRT